MLDNDILTLKEKHEYEAEIEQLKERLRIMSANHSDVKSKYSRLRVRYDEMITTRTDSARELIKRRFNGEKMRLQEIANKSGLSYFTVRKLSSELVA